MEGLNRLQSSVDLLDREVKAFRRAAAARGLDFNTTHKAMAPATSLSSTFEVSLRDGTRVSFKWDAFGFGSPQELAKRPSHLLLNQGFSESYARALAAERKARFTQASGERRLFLGVGFGKVVEVGSEFKVRKGALIDPASSAINRAEFMREFNRSYRAHGGLGKLPAPTLAAKPAPAPAPSAKAGLSPAAAAEVETQVRGLWSGFRRADGTLNWKGARRAGLGQAGSLGQFGLALFLKELAVVAGTGDKARVEEFFDGLMSTDFYKHYGLFMAGAKTADVAYSRYLQRYVRPGFVGGLLRTNLVLAAGLALPALAEGEFEGRAFAISLASLGLSSSAVGAGVRGLKWVTTLGDARKRGLLARAGLGGVKAKALGGWLYTAAELAVILYVADEIETRAKEYLDARKARETLADAGLELVEAVNDPQATPDSVQSASEDYHRAATEYRDFLFRPLHAAEARLSERFVGLARDAKLLSDKRKTLLDRVQDTPSLLRRIEARYGSLDAYSAHLTQKAEGKLEGRMDELLGSYSKERAELLDEAYRIPGDRPDLLEGLEHSEFLLGGSKVGAEDDPWGKRQDFLAQAGRKRAQGALHRALSKSSPDRLGSYAEEAQLYQRLEERLQAEGKHDLAAELRARRTLAEALGAADRELFAQGGAIRPETRAGIRQALNQAAGSR